MNPMFGVAFQAGGKRAISILLEIMLAEFAYELFEGYREGKRERLSEVRRWKSSYYQPTSAMGASSSSQSTRRTRRT